MSTNPTNNTHQHRTNNKRRNRGPKIRVRISRNNRPQTVREYYNEIPVLASVARSARPARFSETVRRNTNFRRNSIPPREAEVMEEVRLEELEDVQVGAPRAVIDNLPTYRQNNEADQEEKQCLICLVDFHDGAKLCLLPCMHRYHARCIRKWLTRNHTCPVCRMSILE